MTRHLNVPGTSVVKFLIDADIVVLGDKMEQFVGSSETQRFL